MVQAEQKQYGSPKTDLSLDQRLRNLETAVFGGVKSGSESKRLKDVCRRIGVLPPEPAAEEPKPVVTDVAAAKKNSQKKPEHADVKPAKKKPKFEMPNEISRPVVPQPMQDVAQPMQEPARPAEHSSSQTLETPTTEPAQPLQTPEPVVTQPAENQPKTAEPGAAQPTDPEVVIPGQSSNGDGISGLVPIIILGGLVVLVVGVTGGAAFLLIRERNRAAGAQKPFEPISEEEQAAAEATARIEPKQKVAEPPPAAPPKNVPTEREITWSDAPESSGATNAPGSRSVASADESPEAPAEENAPQSGALFSVKNRVFKISVTERNLQPIASPVETPPPSSSGFVSRSSKLPPGTADPGFAEPPSFAPYTTDPHSADAFLFQPSSKPEPYAGETASAAAQQLEPVSTSESVAPESWALPELHEPYAEMSEFEPTPSPYAFAPPLPEGARASVELDAEQPDAATVSSYHQAQAKLDALLGRPPAPQAMTPGNLFLPNSSVSEAEQIPQNQAAPLDMQIASDQGGGFSFSALVREAQQQRPESEQSEQLEHEREQAPQEEDQQTTIDGALTTETDWQKVEAPTDDYQEFEPDSEASSTESDDGEPDYGSVVPDAKLHNALQKLNRAYGVLPDPGMMKEGPAGIDNCESSSEPAGAAPDFVAEEALETTAGLEEIAPGLNASSLPKSFATTLAGVLGNARARSLDDSGALPAGVANSASDTCEPAVSESSARTGAESVEPTWNQGNFEEQEPSDSMFVNPATEGKASLDEAISSEYARRDSDDSVFERLLRTLFADDDFHPELFPNLATPAASSELGQSANTAGGGVTIPAATPLRSSVKPAASALAQEPSRSVDQPSGPGLHGNFNDSSAALIRSDSQQYQGQLRSLFSEVSKDDRLRRGEYQAVIYETQPGCLILVVDQSAAMKSPLNPGHSACKSDIVAVVINRFIHRLIKRCKSDSGKIRASWYVGVVGYGDTVGPAFIGKHQGKELVNVCDLSTTVDYVMPDRPKSTIVGIPVWVRPKAAGPARMCGGLSSALKLARDFVADNPTSHPPIIVNISGGSVSDGDPRPLATAIREIQSADGNVLLFNVCLPGRPDNEMLNFPDDPAQLPDHLAAKAMWDMSSPLLVKMIHLARDYQIDISPRARGFAWNSDVTAIAGLLEMCTSET